MENKKIKILFDATLLTYFFETSGVRGGIYFVTKNLLKEFLKKDNVDITLFCSYRRLCYLKEFIKHYKKFKNLKILYDKNITNSYMALMEQLKYKYRKNKGKDNLFKKIIRWVAFRSCNLYEKTRKNNLNFFKKLNDFDIYFSPVEPIPKEIYEISKIKSFLFLHDVIPLGMKNFYNEMNEAKEWFDTLLNSLNQSGVYFTNSENTKQDFIKIMHNINPENIIVTPLGVSEEFYRETSIEKINKIKGKYNIPQNKKYLFSLCTLEPRKNIIFAVKNFVEFIKQNNIDDFIFVIGGAHWDKFLPILEKEIDNCEEYKSKILKIGYVEDEDVPLLYNGAEMFVYPSLYEGFGMPILEAMKCGCPVICSNTSSMPEVIGDCGIQIDPTKDEEMIQALEKMYHDREFRQVCIEKGIERAKEFSWEKSAKIMIDKMKEEFYKEDNN